MPKLHQKRSTRGCLRCKARKVKCDEIFPDCSACQRHQVACVYPPQKPSSSPKELNGNHLGHSISSDGSNSPSAHNGNATISRSPERLLELRLLYHYCWNTGPSLTTVPSIWADTLPRLGLTHPFLLDACFAASALHLSRLDPTDAHLEDVSVTYFEKAIAGHAKAQQTTDVAAVADAMFLATGLITFYSLARMGNPTPQEENALFQWLALGRGARIIYIAFNLQSPTEVALAAIRAPPNVMDEGEIFNPANITDDLKVLLEWGADFEMITAEDRKTYEETLSYISLIYTSAEKGEPFTYTSRRLLGLPSRAPEHFHDLVAERRPRALVMLAYYFAAFKLVSDKLWWTRRIAERHVPFVYRIVPPAWKSLVHEPLRRLGLDAADISENGISPSSAST